MQNWNLFLGDALRILPDFEPDTFDLIIADPPYSSGGLHQTARNGDPGSKYTNRSYQTFHGDNMDSRAWFSWSYFWLSEAYRVAKPGAYCMVFSDWRQQANAQAALQAAGFIWRGQLPWDKGSASRLPHPGYFRHQAEYILWGTKGPCNRATHKRTSYDGVLRYSTMSAQKVHPTEKPVDLYKQLIDVVPPGSNVLDPFVGSGASGVAALQKGMSFSGIEYTQHYYDIAQQRLVACT